MQGGLLATTIAQREANAYSGRAAPIAMFLAAKLVAYTVLGALLGWFGAAIGLVGEMGQYLFERDLTAKLGIEGDRDRAQAPLRMRPQDSKTLIGA